MKATFFKTPRMVVMGVTLIAAGLLAGCDVPPQESKQSGYRGTGAAQIENKAQAAAKRRQMLSPKRSLQLMHLVTRLQKPIRM